MTSPAHLSLVIIAREGHSLWKEVVDRGGSFCKLQPNVQHLCILFCVPFFLLPDKKKKKIDSETMATTPSTITESSPTTIQVTGLYRYAVKGLSEDDVDKVEFYRAPDRFADDRRYALLYEANKGAWEEGVWLHKENFLCAFTEPELLSKFKSTYKMVSPEPCISRVLPNDADEEVPRGSDTKRILELHDRATGTKLLGPLQLETEQGRQALADFLSEQSGQKVLCVTSDSFQFGNVPPLPDPIVSTLPDRKDMHGRYIHIVNQATVDDLADKIGTKLYPSRFRPNIVVKGPPAWTEFDWIGKTLTMSGGLALRVIEKAVRCKAVTVDPMDPGVILDIPTLLQDKFPQYGPYLGVYAVVDYAPASISVGDELQLVSP
jgi:uncharacterized protein YcbX